jgi:hypothetical protein
VKVTKPVVAIDVVNVGSVVQSVHFIEAVNPKEQNKSFVKVLAVSM